MGAAGPINFYKGIILTKSIIVSTHFDNFDIRMEVSMKPCTQLIQIPEEVPIVDKYFNKNSWQALMIFVVCKGYS